MNKNFLSDILADDIYTVAKSFSSVTSRDFLRHTHFQMYV